MSLDRLRQVAEEADDSAGMTWEALRTLDHFNRTFDPPTVKALLDVADAAHRAMYGPAHGTRPTDDLADALERLREVSS